MRYGDKWKKIGATPIINPLIPYNPFKTIEINKINNFQTNSDITVKFYIWVEGDEKKWSMDIFRISPFLDRMAWPFKTIEQ